MPFHVSIATQKAGWRPCKIIRAELASVIESMPLRLQLPKRR
jgi:hypothetical protein